MVPRMRYGALHALWCPACAVVPCMRCGALHALWCQALHHLRAAVTLAPDHLLEINAKLGEATTTLSIKAGAIVQST